MKISSHISFWIFIAMSIILVIFSVQNSGPIEVDLIFTKAEVSLAILLMVTFTAGLIAGALYAYVKLSNKQKKQQINEIKTSKG